MLKVFIDNGARRPDAIISAFGDILADYCNEAHGTGKISDELKSKKEYWDAMTFAAYQMYILGVEDGMNGATAQRVGKLDATIRREHIESLKDKSSDT